MAVYVDLQVNGYAGVDFNADDVTEEQLAEVCERLSADGVQQILATVITAPLEAMTARLSNLARHIERVPEIGRMIGGLHVEGPFINPQPGFVGAHPASAVEPASSETARRLVEAGGGHVKLFTLAPEMDERARVTEELSRQGIAVAAGHSDASRDQLCESIDAGLKLFTHLGNGCPAMLARHDNIIQRVLSLADRLMISFIADGHHVPFPALRNYVRCIPDENVVIVTDAISAAGLGPGRYQLAGQTVEVDSAGAAWSADRTHFAGSAATMPKMAKLLTEQMTLGPARIQRWMSDNPRRLIAS